MSLVGAVQSNLQRVPASKEQPGLLYATVGFGAKVEITTPWFPPKMSAPYLHEHLSNDHIVVILKHRAEDYRDSVLFRLNIPEGNKTHERKCTIRMGFS